MHPDGPLGQPPHGRGLPKIGQVLGGKYEIVRLLGEGGMAYVFEASHNRLEQRVAIKVLAPEFARDAELVLRFEREARAVARLRTRHVARVIDVDATEDHVPYIVMEFLDGRDLDAELEERTRLPLDEAVDIVLQTCAGMVEAHGLGIVHRDLKPANLFLAREGERNERVVKVLDFGISKVVGDATKLTSAGAVMGTVLYMSPEQVRAQPSVDTRADIWALGVILYELIAGRPPWEGSSQQIAGAIVSKNPPDIRKFVPVPETVATVLRTMLERDPERRFASVQDVVASLATFAPAGSIGALVADQLAGTQSGRARGSLPAGKQVTLPTHTIPMGSRPSALEAAMANAPRPAAGTPTAVARLAPAPANSGSPSRLVLVLAIALGLIGAVGLGFVVLAKIRKTPVPTAVADAARSAHASSAPPADTNATPPPAASTQEIVAAPPPTGTAARTSTHGAHPPPATSTRKDGGAARPSSGAAPAPAFL